MKRMNRTELNVAITAFLDARSKSDGGFAPVGPTDVEQLDVIIEGLVGLKYEADPDGDQPIRWQLCDWTRFEPNHFSLIPHTTSRVEAKVFENALDVAVGNLKIAADKVDLLQRCRRREGPTEGDVTEEQTRILKKLHEVADGLKSTNALRGREIDDLSRRIESQFRRTS